MERITIETGGLTFDARAAGPADGDPVLLLHGFPQSSWCYRHQIEALGAAGYRAVAPDQRGYSPGARPTTVEDYAMGHLVGDVLGMMDALGIDRVHLVGHDWGGAVAWQVAGRHGDRLRSLSILSMPHPSAFGAALAGTFGGDQASRSGYMAMLQTDGSEDVLLADDAAVLRGIYSFADGRPMESAPYLELLGDRAALTGAVNWYRAIGLSGDMALMAPMQAIEVPTLYVWSTGDTALGREAAEATADHVSGPYRFEVVDGASHWIAEEVPERVTAELLAHLAAHPS